MRGTGGGDKLGPLAGGEPEEGEERRTGDFKDAEARIAPTPLYCRLCPRARGQVAAAPGDAAGADRFFAEAVRQAPSLPFALSEWGEALAARGDLRGAAEKFRLAHAAGPKWADPLRRWGDLLIRTGDRGGALSKYDEALRSAPNWPQLMRAR